MQTLSKLFAVLAIIAMASFVSAADKGAKGAGGAKGLRGSVVKVDGTNLVIKSGKGADAKEVTVATDDKTVVTIDGQPGKLADLKEGLRVQVTPETGTAQTITAMTAKPKNK